MHTEKQQKKQSPNEIEIKKDTFYILAILQTKRQLPPALAITERPNRQIDGDLGRQKS